LERTTVAIWASLEALIEDIVVESFQHNPSLLQAEAIRKIKIGFGEYELLNPEERLRFVVKELARQTNADLKQGVNRFETLLENVGLSGPTP
jgi:hypothetical protein